MLTFYSHCKTEENKKNEADTNLKGFRCLHSSYFLQYIFILKFIESYCNKANRIAISM